MIAAMTAVRKNLLGVKVFSSLLLSNRSAICTNRELAQVSRTCCTLQWLVHFLWPLGVLTKKNRPCMTWLNKRDHCLRPRLCVQVSERCMPLARLFLQVTRIIRFLEQQDFLSLCSLVRHCAYERWLCRSTAYTSNSERCAFLITKSMRRNLGIRVAS